jgi:hypothetical protein
VLGHDQDRPHAAEAEEVGEGAGQLELDGAIVSGPNLLDLRERLGDDLRRQRLLREVVEGESHVLGGQRVAVVPGDALAKGEGVGGSVVGRLEALGQPGQDLSGRVLPNERVVDERSVDKTRPTHVGEGRRQAEVSAGEPEGGSRQRGLVGGARRGGGPRAGIVFGAGARPQHQSATQPDASDEESPSVHRRTIATGWI